MNHEITLRINGEVLRVKFLQLRYSIDALSSTLTLHHLDASSLNTAPKIKDEITLTSKGQSVFKGCIKTITQEGTSTGQVLGVEAQNALAFRLDDRLKFQSRNNRLGEWASVVSRLYGVKLSADKEASTIMGLSLLRFQNPWQKLKSTNSLLGDSIDNAFSSLSPNQGPSMFCQSPIMELQKYCQSTGLELYANQHGGLHASSILGNEAKEAMRTHNCIAFSRTHQYENFDQKIVAQGLDSYDLGGVLGSLFQHDAHAEIFDASASVQGAGLAGTLSKVFASLKASFIKHDTLKLTLDSWHAPSGALWFLSSQVQMLDAGAISGAWMVRGVHFELDALRGTQAKLLLSRSFRASQRWKLFLRKQI